MKSIKHLSIFTVLMGTLLEGCKNNNNHVSSMPPSEKPIEKPDSETKNIEKVPIKMMVESPQTKFTFWDEKFAVSVWLQREDKKSWWADRDDYNGNLIIEIFKDGSLQRELHESISTSLNTYTFKDLNPGKYILSIKYFGDKLHQDIQGEYLIELPKVMTGFNIFQDRLYYFQDQTTQWSATVKSYSNLNTQLTGTVNFEIFDESDKLIQNCETSEYEISAMNSYTFKCTISPLEIGKYSIKASYSGDENYKENITYTSPFIVGKNEEA